jgi:hypothetical protein
MYERGIFEWGGFVILLVARHAPWRDFCVNCPIGRVSVEWGCSRGRFERAATPHPDCSGGVGEREYHPMHTAVLRSRLQRWGPGDEVCGKAGRESRRDMESYDTVNGSKSFPTEARRDAYSNTTSSIKDGPADYGRVYGIANRTVRRQR